MGATGEVYVGRGRWDSHGGAPKDESHYLAREQLCMFVRMYDIVRNLESVSEGPWYFKQFAPFPANKFIVCNKPKGHATEQRVVCEVQWGGSQECKFIAESRVDVPWLVEKLGEATKLLQQLYTASEMGGYAVSSEVKQWFARHGIDPKEIEDDDVFRRKVRGAGEALPGSGVLLEDDGVSSPQIGKGEADRERGHSSAY